jgi:hypothetical protein
LGEGKLETRNSKPPSGSEGAGAVDIKIFL